MEYIKRYLRQKSDMCDSCPLKIWEKCARNECKLLDIAMDLMDLEDDFNEWLQKEREREIEIKRNYIVEKVSNPYGNDYIRYIPKNNDDHLDNNGMWRHR